MCLAEPSLGFLLASDHRFVQRCEKLVRGQVSPPDIDTVKPGLPAQVRLTAFKQRSTPTLDGRAMPLSTEAAVRTVGLVKAAPEGAARRPSRCIRPRREPRGGSDSRRETSDGAT